MTCIGNVHLVMLSMLCMVAGPCRADHPDRMHRPSGRAETSLSGVFINVPAHDAVRNADGVFIEPMAVVLRALGKPSKVIVVNKCESTYVWVVDGVRTEVGSGCVYKEVAGKNVMRTRGAYTIEVWGTRSVGRFGATGRGLALGDRWSKVKRLYGTRCECGQYVSGTGTQFTHGLKYAVNARYQWKNKVELDVDADAQGRVVHMLLVGDLE